MPTYEYRCVSCDHQFERFQRITDEPVKECEICGEPVKRLLFPVAIHFKGSGFYTTDYAHKNALATPGSSGGNGSSEATGGTSDDSNSNGNGSSAKGKASVAAGDD